VEVLSWERAFFQLVGSVTDLVLIVDGSTITYANRGRRRRWDIPRDGLRGRPVHEVAHPEEREGSTQRIQETLFGAFARGRIRRDMGHLEAKLASMLEQGQNAPRGAHCAGMGILICGFAAALHD